MSEVLTRLPATKKVIAAILAIFMLGMFVAWTYGDIRGLPERMAAVEARVDAVDNGMKRLESKVELGNCLQLAEKRGSQWEECLEAR